jgi:lipopolysaccharide/colanic/teichoic acid biosynthesis glycosyltransferase
MERPPHERARHGTSIARLFPDRLSAVATTRESARMSESTAREIHFRGAAGERPGVTALPGASPEGVEVELRAFRPPGAKRLLDILGASVLLVLFAPLAGLIAIAIRLDSPGLMIYRQVRVGLDRRRVHRRREFLPVASNFRREDRRGPDTDGKPFQIFKFRTMVANAEQNVGPIWALKDDPRITRVGRILRATRLDELPQIWNVLRGDMSLVGPRPERPYFVRRFVKHIPGYHSRLYANPGITGLAQVEHRYDTTEDDVRTKLGYDLAYIERYSILADLRILAKTVLVMITRKGAH